MAQQQEVSRVAYEYTNIFVMRVDDGFKKRTFAKEDYNRLRGVFPNASVAYPNDPLPLDFGKVPIEDTLVAPPDTIMALKHGRTKFYLEKDKVGGIRALSKGENPSVVARDIKKLIEELDKIVPVPFKQKHLEELYPFDMKLSFYISSRQNALEFLTNRLGRRMISKLSSQSPGSVYFPSVGLYYRGPDVMERRTISVETDKNSGDYRVLVEWGHDFYKSLVFLDEIDKRVDEGVLVVDGLEAAVSD